MQQGAEGPCTKNIGVVYLSYGTYYNYFLIDENNWLVQMAEMNHAPCMRKDYWLLFSESVM